MRRAWKGMWKNRYIQHFPRSTLRFFFFQNFFFKRFVYICYLVYLQMVGDMEQQIPVISVPMPGKKTQQI